MRLKDAGGMVNSVDPDQTGAVWSGSTLSALTYLSRYLEFIQNMYKKLEHIYSR